MELKNYTMYNKSNSMVRLCSKNAIFDLIEICVSDHV